MSRRGSLTLPLLIAIALPACQKASGSGKDVEELGKKLDAVEKRMAKLEGFLGPYMNQPPPPPEPDPTAVYAVPIEGAPVAGPETALVTLVEGYEFACPYCEKVRPTIAELKKQYGDDLRVVYKQFVVHPDAATVPALAACAAAEQGKFDVLEPLIWDKGFKQGDLSPELMKKLAAEAKLDMARFEAAMAGPACAERIAKDQDDLRKVGTNGTPAFYINGRFLSGAQPVDRFKKVIDEELAKAKAAVAAGTSPADYYQVAVLDKGLKELPQPPPAKPEAEAEAAK